MELRGEQDQSRRRWEELDAQRERVAASHLELDRESKRLEVARQQSARVRDESAA